MEEVREETSAPAPQTLWAHFSLEQIKAQAP